MKRMVLILVMVAVVAVALAGSPAVARRSCGQVRADYRRARAVVSVAETMRRDDSLWFETNDPQTRRLQKEFQRLIDSVDVAFQR